MIVVLVRALNRGLVEAEQNGTAAFASANR